MKNKLLKIALSVCSLVCFAIAGIGIAFNLGNYGDAQAYEITLDDASALQTEYGYGDLLTIPSGTIDGVRASRYVVVSPTGAKYATPTVSLSESGQYTIIWYATIGGQEVAASRIFTVSKSVFETTGSAKWSYQEQLEKVTNREVSGVKVQISPESTFTYNRAIDLADSSQSFIKLYPNQGILNLQEAFDTAKTDNPIPYQFNIEARNIYITLTDCYDPTNYVKIDLEWAPNKDSNRTYWNFRAGAAGQTAHGIRGAWKEGSAYSSCDVDGTAMVYMLAPGQGATQCNVTDNYGIEFFYDTELNRVYTTHYRYSGTSIGYEKYRDHQIMADLANADIYPKNPFKGFKGTEVYLTISAGNFISTSATVEIESLGGLSGGEMLNATMNDTKAPMIEVADALKSGSIKVAKGEEVAIPDALVYDVSMPFGTLAQKTVYYGYDPSSSHNTVQPLTKGKFTPAKNGTYSIIYSATDGSGNVGTARVDLSVQSNVNTAVVFGVPAQVNASAGSYIDVPASELSGLYTDDSAVKKYVKFEDEDEYLLKGDKLFLEGVGNYVITYEYETPLKTYTATCTIVAAASGTVSISEPALPKYLIKNAQYTLDPAYAYEYNGKKPTATVADTYMSSDGGEYVAIDSDAVTITANSTAKFKYVHGGETKYSDTISVVDVGFGGTLRMKDYFYTTSSTVTSSSSYDGLKYVLSGSEAVTFEYVNVLSLSFFNIEFSFLNTDGAALPGSTKFTLIDFYDRTKTIELSIVNNSFYIDGERMAAFENSLLNERLTLSYASGSFKFDGKVFAYDGSFTSDKFLLKIEIGNMSKKANFAITKFCGRMMTDSAEDDLKPALATDAVHTGYQAYNGVITITQAQALDVIAPYVKSGLHLKVMKPNGSYATSLDGVLLDGTCPIDREYDLKLTDIGFYTVLYEYIDQNGGRGTLSYRPVIRDEIAPTITVSGVKENSTVKAAYGATVKLADYTVSDNVSSGETLCSYVSVLAPSEQITAVNNGKFYAKEKGTYTVIYFCYDEAGNNTSFLYYVKVA